MWDILGLIVGIVFAYLLLSLLATIIQELIASVLSMRGKFLLGAMVQLLELDWVDESELAGTPEGQKIKAMQAKRKEKKEEWIKNIKQTRVYQKYMNRAGWVTTLPSYLSAEQVIAILQELMVDQPANGGEDQIPDDVPKEGTGELRGRGAGRILTPGANLPQDEPGAGSGVERSAASAVLQVRAVKPEKPKMLQSMKHLKLQNNLQKLNELTKQQAVSTDQLGEAEKISRSISMPGDVQGKIQEFEDKVTEKFNHIKQEITNDFNDMMDRTSGWYKKRAQLVLFVIGMLIAVAFDADTFAMYRALSNNPEARQEVMALASQFVTSGSAESLSPTAAGSGSPDEQLSELRKQANILIANELSNLETGLGLGRTSFPEPVPGAEAGAPVATQQVILFRGGKFLGWLITALAISLGSTFWFDILKQLINIRSAGVKPGGVK